MDHNTKEFVNYLNTLHRCGGNNKNSTAEANYKNTYAHDILYNDDKLINHIESELFINNGKVLLTGFAGDGKTTLAQIIVENLTGKKELNNRIEKFYIEKYKRDLVVIKDLSEYSIENNDELITNYLLNDNCSILIVSNTGAIIYRMKEAYKLLKYNSKEDVEKLILDGISTEDKDGYGNIELNLVNISVINLVNHDNLPAAKGILNNIVFHKVWEDYNIENDLCPIILNVRALQQEYVRNRLFLMYQRLFEYGYRFTLRNFVEHFSYIITGGLELTDTVINPDDYLFYNNVFGSFEKNEKDITCNDIAIINKIRSEYFGSTISSLWKRLIWDKSSDIVFNGVYKPFRKYFINYRDKGYKKESNIDRLKIYRLIYFLLSDDIINNKKFTSYFNSFLNSPGLELWSKIQSENESLNSKETFDLFNNLKHTIKEYFAGLKLPTNENGNNKDIVYITMSRKKGIRQSAQVVLSQFEWKNDSKVKLDIYEDSRSIKQFRLLMVKDIAYNNFSKSNFNINNYIVLNLPLPFLDYLLFANAGTLFDDEFQYFQKRLDLFKNQIISNQIDQENKDNKQLLLVRLKPDRNLGDINFKLIEGHNQQKLEVY